MKNKDYIINNTRVKRNTRTYKKKAKLSNHFGTPTLKRLKSAARNRLRRVLKLAEKAGYQMHHATYDAALERIKDMQTVEQYEDFISDTNRIAKQLYAAIERNQQAPYFKKT